HALVRDLRDVYETVLARKDLDEGAEIHEPDDLAFVNSAALAVRRNELDATLRLAARGAADRGDLDGAVVLDVDRGAGLFRDGADDRPALADDFADLLGVDLDRDDRRRPLGHRLARLRDDLRHLA